MFCLYTSPLARLALAKIQMLTAICSIVKLILVMKLIWVIFTTNTFSGDTSSINPDTTTVTTNTTSSYTTSISTTDTTSFTSPSEESSSVTGSPTPDSTYSGTSNDGSTYFDTTTEDTFSSTEKPEDCLDQEENFIGCPEGQIFCLNKGIILLLICLVSVFQNNFQTQSWLNQRNLVNLCANTYVDFLRNPRFKNWS